jgi:hypothetical protein
LRPFVNRSPLLFTAAALRYFDRSTDLLSRWHHDQILTWDPEEEREEKREKGRNRIDLNEKRRIKKER